MARSQYSLNNPGIMESSGSEDRQNMAEQEDAREPRSIDVQGVPSLPEEESPSTSLPFDVSSTVLAGAEEAPSQSRDGTRSPPIVRARAAGRGSNGPLGYERSSDSLATDASLTSSVFSIDFGDGAGSRASRKRVSPKLQSGQSLMVQDSSLFSEVDLLRRQVLHSLPRQPSFLTVDLAALVRCPFR